MAVVSLQKVLFVVFVNCDCLAYHDCYCHDVAMVVMLNVVVIMLSVTFHFCMLSYTLQVQIRDAEKEETALEVYWVTDSVDRSWFCSLAPCQSMGKYNGVLAQIMHCFSAADDSNYMVLQKWF